MITESHLTVLEKCEHRGVKVVHCGRRAVDTAVQARPTATRDGPEVSGTRSRQAAAAPAPWSQQPVVPSGNELHMSLTGGGVSGCVGGAHAGALGIAWVTPIVVLRGCDRRGRWGGDV